MLVYTGGKVSISETKLPALNAAGATFYFSFIANNPSSATEQTIFRIGHLTVLAEYSHMGVQNGYLQWTTGTYSLLKGGAGTHKVAISANTYYRGSISYPFAGTTANPVITLNGVTQTLTNSAGSGLTAQSTPDYLIVGGMSFYNAALGGTNNNIDTAARQFDGGLFEFYGYLGQDTAAEQCLATASNMGSYLQKNRSLANRLFVYRCHEIPDAVAPVRVATLVPNADISGTWGYKSTATYYASANADDVNYIAAVDGDENKVQVLGFNEDSLAADEYVGAVQFGIKGGDDTDPSENLTFKVSKGGTYGHAVTTNFASAGTTYSYEGLYMYDEFSSEWSQSDINSIQMSITAPASISKYNEVMVNYAWVKLYIHKKLYRADDYSGNNRHLVHRGVTGKAQAFLGDY